MNGVIKTETSLSNPYLLKLFIIFLFIKIWNSLVKQIWPTSQTLNSLLFVYPPVFLFFNVLKGVPPVHVTPPPLRLLFLPEEKHQNFTLSLSDSFRKTGRPYNTLWLTWGPEDSLSVSIPSVFCVLLFCRTTTRHTYW